MEPQELEIITEFVTDWWTIGATIFAGILTAAATFIAVCYTNKKTVEMYEKDKDYKNKRDNMVIIKPTIKSCSFSRIIDELVCYNIRDRVLLISSEKDGFDFYDDDNRLYSENHRIFSIKNESKNNIHSVQIEMHSRLKTDSNLVIDDTYYNFIKLLRSNEEIVFRVHSTEQRNKLWEELDKNKQVDLSFDCKINYLTPANEQVYYEYEAQIRNIPETKMINGEAVSTNNAKTSIIKDEYRILEKSTIDEQQQASVFRNIQDGILIDRVNYIHKKIGTAQAQGLMSEMGSAFGNQTGQTVAVIAQKIDDMNKDETKALK